MIAVMIIIVTELKAIDHSECLISQVVENCNSLRSYKTVFSPIRVDQIQFGEWPE